MKKNILIAIVAIFLVLIYFIGCDSKNIKIVKNGTLAEDVSIYKTMTIGTAIDGDSICKDTSWADVSTKDLRLVDVVCNTRDIKEDDKNRKIYVKEQVEENLKKLNEEKYNLFVELQDELDGNLENEKQCKYMFNLSCEDANATAKYILDEFKKGIDKIKFKSLQDMFYDEYISKSIKQTMKEISLELAKKYPDYASSRFYKNSTKESNCEIKTENFNKDLALKSIKSVMEKALADKQTMAASLFFDNKPTTLYHYVTSIRDKKFRKMFDSLVVCKNLSFDYNRMEKFYVLVDKLGKNKELEELHQGIFDLYYSSIYNKKEGIEPNFLGYKFQFVINTDDSVALRKIYKKYINDKEEEINNERILVDIYER